MAEGRAPRTLRLPARLGPALAALAARRERWLPLLAAGVVLGVLGAALLLNGPGQVAQSREIQLQDAQPDTGLAQLDSDRDLLSDLEELVAGTNPEGNDTDSDGLPDLWEVRNARLDPLSNTYCPDPLAADAERDCDGDGLGNEREFRAGTNPNVADVDGDGLPDGMEVRCGSDPFTPDAELDPDGDNLPNLEELRLGTRCDLADSDLDGLADPEELQLTRTNPVRASTSGSGIPDGWLHAFNLALDDAGVGFRDPDDDGLTNLEEAQASVALAARESQRLGQPLQGRELLQFFLRGLDPFSADTDRDGMPDGFEVRFGLDPLDDGRGDARLGPAGDPDGDGLTNLQESGQGSNPFLVDTDGDGLTDPQEVQGWTIRVGDQARNVTSDPSRADSDGDGLLDLEERQGKAVRAGVEHTFPPLDPRSPDTDVDGLGDLEEVLLPITAPADPRRLDPTNPDTDGDGLLDGEEHRYWLARRDATGAAAEEVLERLVKEMAGSGAPVTREAALHALGPGGDLDGNGRPNLLDRDSDGDGIDDGKEVRPDDRATSEGSSASQPLPATDPALRDSDGDALPDKWENDFAVYDFLLADWNLNASSRDSLRLNDGLTDAHRDLDRDGVLHDGPAYARRIVFNHTNRFEFLAGTHPNQRDSDGDGLGDGWETYFSCITALSPRRGCADLTRLDHVQRLVDLDPTKKDSDGNGTLDGAETGASTPYVRFVKASVPLPPGTLRAANLERFQACENTALEPLCDLFPGNGVVRIHGQHLLNFTQVAQRGLDPSVRDTDGDGMEDAWELANSLLPLERSDAQGDSDGDGRTNVQEALAGTDPLSKDTDLGGVEDDKDPNPLYPPDDAPLGDTDCDGVTNAAEGQQLTSLADVDSDADGLIDGPSIAFWAANEVTDASNKPLLLRATTVVAREGCSLDLAALQARFAARGIAQNRTGNQVTFLGEAAFGTSPSKRDTDGDHIPDGWESYWIDAHGLQGSRDPVDPGVFNDEGLKKDALDNLQEYRVGMPEGWEEQGCGVWWFGTDPRSLDSDGDGVEDGAVVGTEAKGFDFDLDNDGLDDFTGEDPVPFMHPLNGASPLAPCAAYFAHVEEWVFKGGRKASAKLEGKPGIKLRDDYARTRFTELTADLDPDGLLPPDEKNRTLLKGSSFIVRGRLVVAEGTADKDKPVPGVPVLVNLDTRSGRRQDVLGVAMTGADGRFEVLGALRGAANATLPQAAVLFGAVAAAGQAIAWEPDTTRMEPRASYRVVVWSPSVQAGAAGPFGFKALTQGGQAFDARGVRNATVVSDNAGALALPLLVMKTGSSLSLPSKVEVTVGEPLKVAVGLVDDLGDPLPSRFLQDKVRATWQGVTYKGQPELRVRDGGFDLELPVPTTTPLGAHPLHLTYAGDKPLVGESARNAQANVKYPTNTTGKVLNPGRLAVASEGLSVEGKVLDFRGQGVAAGLPVAVRLLGKEFPGNTTAGGAWRVDATVPPTASVGTQTVEVAFLGSDAYASSGASAGEVTLVQKTVLVLEGGRSQLGRDLVIAGSLRDLAGNPVDDPVQDGNTSVRVVTPVLQGSVNVTVTSFRLTVPQALLPGAGPMQVRASFEGSLYYHPSADTKEVQLGSKTRLTLDAAPLARGQPASLTGRLVDEKGNGLAGEAVQVSFGNDTANATTGADGRFARPLHLPESHPLGGVPSRAAYAGGRAGLLEAAEPASAIVRVVAATRLDVPDLTAPLGPLLVTGALRDDRGQPVPGAKLSLSLDGKPLGFAVTNLQGQFEVEVALPDNTTSGTHRLRVAYGGSGDLGPAQADAAYRLLTPTAVSILRLDPLVRGTDAGVLARLLDARGQPLPNRPLELRIDGTVVGTASTDSTGVARLGGKPPTFLQPGNVTVAVVFPGDDGHTPSQASRTAPLLVRTTLTVEMPATVERGEVFGGLIVVRDDTGRPLAQETVVVSFSGYAYPLTLTTDASGRANFTGRMDGPGTGEVLVRFAGRPGLSAAEQGVSVQSRVPILAGAGLLGVAALAAAVVVLGAAVAARRLRAAQVAEVAGILREAGERLMASTEHQASILWAYGRLVEHARSQGFLVEESFTARELLDALAKAMPVSPAHLEQLVEVFEVARYSPHPVGPRHRDMALAALRGIERDLRAAERRSPGVQEAAHG